MVQHGKVPAGLVVAEQLTRGPVLARTGPAPPAPPTTAHHPIFDGGSEFG